jgi:biotin transport system permease protein
MLSLTSAHQTPAHGWRAAPKLGALAGLTFVLFLPLPGVAALCLALAVLALMAGIAFAWGLWPSWAQLLRPLWPFAVLLAVWHWVTATPLEGAVIFARMAAAVGAANLVTMTTRLSDLQAFVLWAARPFDRILPAKALSLAIALMIRFIPVMSDRAGQLRLAWRARSARGVRARVIAPLALSALDDADHVAEALRARGGAG